MVTSDLGELLVYMGISVQMRIQICHNSALCLLVHYMLMWSNSYCPVIVPRNCWRKGTMAGENGSEPPERQAIQTPRRALVQSQVGVLSTPWRKGLVGTAVTHLNARLQIPRRSLVQSHDV